MLAILSNTNCDPIIRRIKKELPCMESTGYGSTFEELLNPGSSVSMTKPDVILLLIDLREYVSLRSGDQTRIDEFFQNIRQALKSECQYFISDASYYMPVETAYRGGETARRAVHYWNTQLYALCEEEHNCAVFPLHDLACELGMSAFYSEKTWYLGSVRYSMDGIKSICGEIRRMMAAVRGDYKKILLLDLDNTLWGGTIGEDGLEGVRLADSGAGKAYKEFQMQVQRLKDAGVVLAIVSKNNEQDAWEMIDHHPHMVLRRQDFAAYRINWERKSSNIQALAEELNVGLDSIVFVDDNLRECQEVSRFLPQVTALPFPELPEEIVAFGKLLTQKYFTKLSVTEEDRHKTEQYQVRGRIAAVKKAAGDFSAFLESLHIVIERKEPQTHLERLLQLVQKTNQFNTTVTRYTRAELERMAASGAWRIFLYEVRDAFANHGLCAAAFVHVGEGARIEEFLMSCRVMGRNIEYGILASIEKSLLEEGFLSVEALFREGPKNAPVRELYDRAGYQLAAETESEKRYCKRTDAGGGEVFVGKVVEQL